MRFTTLVVALAIPTANLRSAEIVIDTPMPPPHWALLQRALLKANSDACREFYHRYFDERGYLMCVERWGGNDGPDDAIENCLHWPILHALGGDDDVLTLYKRAWEGHLRQYTEAKTTEVPFARDGMYFKEFPVTFDWLHNAEGLTVFCLQGLSDPYDERYRKRCRRFADFYTGKPNYDREHKIIRSMFNGSRGPLLRRATALDWAGDPIEVKGRFLPGHGEENYEQMLAHFKDYNDIVGDHPQNMLSTALALNAYMTTGDEKYREWILEYVGAWRDRMIANDHIIPTKIGLDGKIGGPEGKWYGSVYGWAFTVVVPQNGNLAHRNTHYLGLPGFMNAYLLTGDDGYLDPWRKQIAKINSQKKTVNGRAVYPHMHGEKGWYNFTTAPYKVGVREIAYLTMKDEDRARVGKDPWFRYLEGENGDYAVRSLQADLARIRKQVERMRSDTTTPDTRLADDSMQLNPANVNSMVELAMGGLPTPKQGLVLHARLRYFDPERRRAGLPEDVAALVTAMTDDTVDVALINTNPIRQRTVIIQGGSYGEHQIESATVDKRKTSVGSRTIRVRLAAGAGAKLLLKMKRHANPPAIAFPW